MSKKTKAYSAIFLSFSLLGSSLLLSTEGKAGTRTGTISTSRGGSGNYSHTRSGNSNNFNRSFTSASGRNYGVQGSGTYDPNTKSYSGNRTVTGPQGQQYNYGVNKQYSGNGSQVNTYTGPNGKTSQVNINRSYDPNTGTYNKQYVGSQGNTVNSNSNYNPNNQTLSRTVSGPQGNSNSYATQRVYDPSTGTYSYVQTRPYGGSVTVNPNQ
ncbi:MAG: hypothetical protein SFT81_01125 [Candidatus Caenarcaniphilales bacterium]|nr:hypothetical protein [Candidatus Caenarcaniphilales bacterium]